MDVNVCGRGEQAMSAASLLQRAGHTDVAVLAGGPDALGELETGNPS
jgi:hydroxyacylglutathione hydrolase